MTDIKLTEFTEWLISRKYSPQTVTTYTTLIRRVAEKNLNFSDIEYLDVEDAYRLIHGRNAPRRHTARASCQPIRSYREFLDRGVVQ